MRYHVQQMSTDQTRLYVSLDCLAIMMANRLVRNFLKILLRGYSKGKKDKMGQNRITPIKHVMRP